MGLIMLIPPQNDQVTHIINSVASLYFLHRFGCPGYHFDVVKRTIKNWLNSEKSKPFQ